MNLSDLARPDPNFTILVPGGCNAKCQFCFWNADFGRIRPPANYLEELRRVLLVLPESFRTISVSGGEPSVSKMLIPILQAIDSTRRSRHYDRVVLTTNGSNMEVLKKIAAEALIDHLNISRHHYNDAKNEEIFKTKAIPSSAELQELIQCIHRTSAVDVCMNAVVTTVLPAEDTDELCARDLIDYAKGTGFDAVSLRKVATDVTPTPAEVAFRKRYGVKHETKCPVCRGMVQDVDGFEVRWKGSVTEPSIVSGKTYEAVFHPDGKLYADWGMKVPLKHSGDTLGRPAKALPKVEEKVKVVYVDRPVSSEGRSGCGSGGCGSRC